MLARDITLRDTTCQAYPSHIPREPSAGGAMKALMQDFPLTLHHVLWRIEKLFARKEIATLTDDGMHRISYGEMALRVRRLASALQNLGVREGDCIDRKSTR